ncbi:MAG: PAS domain S-box protein [Bacteroidales bacterium]|nr:PAS domain S-box protein [Bacteroidales bacterium]
MKTDMLDLIDFAHVDSLLEGFNRSTGFVTAILDLNGKVLSKSGWRQVCTDFHRINPETSKKCTISDTELAGKLAQGEKYHFYKCLNGLVDVAVPIVINGEHIANLFSGQFFFEEPDHKFFMEQAGKYGFNEKKYLDALKKVPVVSKEKVLNAMDFLLNMTQLISEITFQKLELLKVNEALKKSEERSRSTLDSMLEGCQLIGFDWKYIYLNRTAEIHNRRPNNELLGNRYMDMWPGIEQTEVFKTIKQTLETRVNNHLENEFEFQDGSHAWFDLSIQPVPEGVFILSIDITERKKAEQAQLESEEKYRLISDNSDDWIYWLKPDGHLHYVSPACERVTGYSPGEFTEHPELHHQIVFDADKEKVRQHSRFKISEINPHELEYRIITKGGELRWISHSCSPVFGNNGEYLGRRGTNRNITELKHREEQLFESEFRFGKLYENGPFGMVMADKEFRFLNANPEFCAIMGYSEAELQQFTFMDVTHPDDLPKDMLNVSKLINKEISVYKTEKRYIKKDGQIIWGSLTVTTTYDSEGRFLYNLGIIEDVTERKKTEEEIKKLNAELEMKVEQRTAQLEASNKELETFTYSVSHDLKAPLRGIDGYSKLLLDLYKSSLNEEAQTFIETIRSSTLQMNQLIDDLLDYSRLERSQLSLQSIRIRDLVQSVLSIYKVELEERKFEVHSIVSDIEVIADPKGLTIALRNLLENAIKFTKGKTIPKIQIEVNEKNESLIISVNDNGIGFDMKYHQKIYEIFQRLQRAEDFPGTGIGLAMVNKAMHRMNGRAWADSEPGMGSTFYLEIPKNQ